MKLVCSFQTNYFYHTAISIMPGAVLLRLMVDLFESGTVLGGLGYVGKSYHFADVGNMLYKTYLIKICHI